MANRILFCLDLNFSMYFRVWSKSPATFKTKIFIITVNNSFQPLPIFWHKELYLWCCIGLDLNTVTWSTKILKGIGATTYGPIPWSNATLGKFILLDALKINFHKFFSLSFFHLISNGINGVSINSLIKIVALL